MCFSHIPLLVWLIVSSDESYIRIRESVHISAWASTLLVQQSWAMRRPQSVGRVTRRSHAFRLFKSLTLGDGLVRKGISMDYLKADKQRKEWGDKPCSHPNLEVETHLATGYVAVKTGDFVCPICGQDFTKDEVDKIMAERNATK